MDLKEAIVHCEEQVLKTDNCTRKEEHVQLKKWLLELQQYRDLNKNKTITIPKNTEVPYYNTETNCIETAKLLKDFTVEISVEFQVSSKELEIHSVGYSYEDLIDEIKEDLGFSYYFYGLAEDNLLTSRAKELKQSVLKYIGGKED